MKDDLPLHIMSNGDVFPCALLVGEAKPLGNLLKEPLWKIIERKCPKPCYFKLTEMEHMKHACPIRKFKVCEI
jgi:MoaA/NifB/PqqE/SkfB family radical SAM enzyme